MRTVIAYLFAAAWLCLALTSSVRAQNQHYYVANLLPPDDYLALRTLPTTAAGGRVTTLPNGALVDVLEQRPDGWWRLRVVASGAEGWALSGAHGKSWILCCGAEQAAAPAPTSESQYFHTPSGNIHCMADNFDGPSLRCDVREMTNPQPPAPSDCQLSWGNSYTIKPNSPRGELFCHGDTVFMSDSPVLGYGQVWQGLGFTCRSETAGLTCFNALQHGFFVSRNAQRVF